MISKYLIYIRPQRCNHCKAVSYSKHLMAIDEDGKGTACKTISFNVPIGRTQLNVEEIPVCDLCLSEYPTHIHPKPSSKEDFALTIESKNKKPAPFSGNNPTIGFDKQEEKKIETPNDLLDEFDI